MNQKNLPLLVLLAVASCLLFPAMLSAQNSGRNCFRWEIGTAFDVNRSRSAHFDSPSEISEIGLDGTINFRFAKNGAMSFTVPAFDFDPVTFGAINHVFYLTIRFKDTAAQSVSVCALKGGDSIGGYAYVGAIGGECDGKWKEQTVTIPRSSLRCMDGRSFGFQLRDISAELPVDWVMVFSSDSDAPDKQRRISEAAEWDSHRRSVQLQKLLPQFREIPLPDPGPCLPLTSQEQQQGFRLFFPPVSRSLFANSQPRDSELLQELNLRACPEQFQSFNIAIRGLKDLGQVKVSLSDLAGGESAIPAASTVIRWAAFSPQRAGGSRGKTFRVSPERLFQADSQPVEPKQLALLCATLKVPAAARPGRYNGQLAVTTERGGKAVVPVTLTVYPFTLEHPDHATHGLFYYAPIGELSPIELQDMKDHGMDSIVAALTPRAEKWRGRFRGMEKVEDAFALLKKYGFRSPVIVNTAMLNSLWLENEPQNRQIHGEIIQAVKDAAEKAGFTRTGFFPVDEPFEQKVLDEAALTCSWIRDVPGAITFITSNPKAVEVFGKLIDYACYNVSFLNAERIEQVRRSGQTLMWYGPTYACNPVCENRYRAGFYFFKSASLSCHFFSYSVITLDPQLDLDGPSRDWNIVFPSMTSPMPDPTLEWETMREGVDDYRYAYTLRKTADRARAMGKTAEADRAMAVLDELLKEVSPEKTGASPWLPLEADTVLQGEFLQTKLATEAKDQRGDEWFDKTRQKIAAEILKLRQEMERQSPNSKLQIADKSQ